MGLWGAREQPCQLNEWMDRCHDCQFGQGGIDWPAIVLRACLRQGSSEKIATGEVRGSARYDGCRPWVLWASTEKDGIQC